MTITHSTIYSNTAEDDGGGIYLHQGGGVVEITNSTISGNRANGSGGGLYLEAGKSKLTHVTISDNVADDDSDGGAGGGIYHGGGTITLKNTIVAGNSDRSYVFQPRWPDCYGTLTSERYNLVGSLGDSGNPCTLVNSIQDLTGVPAGLDVLQDNGGATETHALLAGSPAIDHIPEDTNGCGSAPLDEDQREVARPQGDAACDIGAFEAAPALAIDKVAVPDTDVAYHGPVTYTIVLSNSGVVPGSDVAFRDTLPDEVDFGSWLEQPTWASVAGDVVTWAGTVPTDTAITFSFVVSHTGNMGDVVVNRAVYTHTIGSGSDEATFTVASGNRVYLPVVLRVVP
jgi:uncharacterized repeat protein (TIGR01451 family)